MPSLPDETLREAVHRVVAAIRSGTVVTYGEVALEAGYPGAARGVGAVMAASDGTLPWWRVVTAAGRLVPGHETEHARRLKAEGVTLRNGRVPMKRVADRADWSGVDEHEHKLALTRHLAGERRGAAPLPGSRRHSPQLDPQLEGVTGPDLAAEPGPVKAAEERQLPGHRAVGEQGDGANLGNGFAHQYSRQGRTAGEMTREEPLVSAEPP